MRVAITGGTGFVGSHAARALIESGHAVRLLARSPEKVERVFAVGPADLVKSALERTEVAAIGPVVAQALAKHDVAVRLMPHDSFFMKPLTSAMEAALGPK